MLKVKSLVLGLLILSPVMTSGCAIFAVTTGAVVGASAAREGGLERAVSDVRIQAQINDLWFKYDVDTYGKLDMTVDQGRVLVTGVVQDPQKRVEAIRLAWQPKGVKQVINEIRIDESGGIWGYSKDLWITTYLRTKLTIDEHVQTLNFTIDTVKGTVYLMGAARSQEELDRAIELAREISGVQQVISYVKLVGTPVETVEAK